MKTRTIIQSLLTALVVSVTQAAPEPALPHALRVTPEIKKAFHSDDTIEIRSIPGTDPKSQTNATYRIAGTCRQHTLQRATLYLGNPAGQGPEAIVASEGSSLSKPLPNGT